MDLRAALVSSGLEIDELMEVVKGLSPTAVAATQASPEAPGSPPAPLTRSEGSVESQIGL